jgi:hypothetical protein
VVVDLEALADPGALADRGVVPMAGERAVVIRVRVIRVAVARVVAAARQTVAVVVRAVPALVVRAVPGRVAQVTQDGEVVVTTVVTTPVVKHAAGQSRLGPGLRRVTMSIPVSGGSLL